MSWQTAPGPVIPHLSGKHPGRLGRRAMRYAVRCATSMGPLPLMRGKSGIISDYGDPS